MAVIDKGVKCCGEEIHPGINLQVSERWWPIKEGLHCIAENGPVI